MNLTAKNMLDALTALDSKLSQKVRLIVGGGGAMLLAHGFSLSTADIDAVPTAGISLDELDRLVKEVAHERSLPTDWLNPYYSTFAHVLPPDYGSRLVPITELRWLKVEALGKEDLLIMKCFAARQKDVVHARALVKKGANLTLVKQQLDFLEKKNIPGTERAKIFLSEIEAFFAAQDDEK
jgi:hypothetical protein